MAVTTELTTLYRTVDELRAITTSVHSRYGETPSDPSLREGADLEGLGGYHR